MEKRRHLIEVDFISPSLAKRPHTPYTVEERARGAAPPHTTVRFRDPHGEVVAFVRKTCSLDETADKLRKQHTTAKGWHKWAYMWQLRLVDACTPTHLHVVRCAAEELEAAIVEKQMVAIQNSDHTWSVAPHEELAILVATARRATHAHIFVYPPQSLFAKAPSIQMHLY